MLQAKNLVKTYGKKDNVFYALNDVSALIEKGSVTAIVGKSGSGKSTLLHLLIGLDKPTSGEVLFNGKDIFAGGKTHKWRSQKVGIIFQQFFLQPKDSVLENVALPLKVQGKKKRYRMSQAKKALELVDMLDKANNKASDLSGGQKQRVAIARAIINRPAILIADEPTGNLDSQNGKIVEDLLFNLNKTLGTTVVIVTHDLDLARRCKRMIQIKDGKIISNVEAKK